MGFSHIEKIFLKQCIELFFTSKSQYDECVTKMTHKKLKNFLTNYEDAKMQECEDVDVNIAW